MTAIAAHWRRGPATAPPAWPQAALAALGAVVLALSALPVDQYHLSPAEADVFHVVNGHTVLPYVVVWPIMQLGNFLAIPVCALIAAAFRRWRLAIAIAVAGVGVYFLAKVVKGFVVRGRPASLLHDAVLRGAPAGGRGYVSGHAAVVTLLCVLAWPYLRPWARGVAVGLAVFVCLARVYVAAHLPLDVIGGAALGLAVGGLGLLLFGRPAR
jgi:membrane-associated phospholipid phosphatase